MATTACKKEILDYLWEWAEDTGDFAKLLVKVVVEKERNLSEDELKLIYNEFLKSIIPNPDESITKIEKPKLTLEPIELNLRSMLNIKGVNRLAENQTLNFAKNITVIYGENATGKSGYSRILKALGFSYEKATKVLSNIYETNPIPQTARIDYTVNGKDDTFAWDGSCKSTDLQNISIFTNNCVNISLNSQRELLVTPIGFHLFSLVSVELDKLAEIHKAKINIYKKNDNYLDALHEGTEVYTFIKSLNADSSQDRLKSLTNYTDNDEKILNGLEDEKKNLNKKLLEVQIISLQNQSTELKTVKSKIETCRDSFLFSNWDEMICYLETISELKKKEQKGIQDIAGEKGILFYESSEFINFIKAADEYIKKINKDNYPKDEKEECIYCRQKLADKEARELLSGYRLLLNDTTQSQIKENDRLFVNLLSKLNNLDVDLILHHHSFGSDEKGIATQPIFLKTFIEDIKNFKKVASTKDLMQIKKIKFEINYEAIINELKQKIELIDKESETKGDSLLKIEEKENELNQKIYNLQDKNYLKQKYTEVNEHIKCMQIVKILESVSKYFGTDSISRKTTEARNDLIASNFNDIFKRELKSLRRDIKINMSFKTEKAKPILIQDICADYALSDVLSEGEQKAIALAEFLTEIQLDRSKATIILDDPVTSLDHKIIDEVARRLVGLSKDRQVVLFTHSILLFNSIKQMSELMLFKDLEYKYYETESDMETAGILYESTSLKGDSFKNYKTKINEIINLPREERERRESDLAIEGYNKLRAAIEVFVEQEMLKNTVKRYRKNVAITSLERVDGALIDKHKNNINTVFERCCLYTDAHSNPDDVSSKPTLSELKTDYEEIFNIRSEFVN